MIIRSSYLIRRALSAQPKNDIGQIFIQENVQRLLKDITRFEDTKVFAKRLVSEVKSSKMMFMSDVDLEKAKLEARENVKARLQMPPVMSPDFSEPEVMSRDKDIVGYTKFKIVFIDISPGYSDRNRLMSVREPDGTLRGPTHEERTRVNHIFYPGESRSIDPPKCFESKHLSRLLNAKEYLFLLNRACVEFEPDDPRYYELTSKVYAHIDDKGDYNLLRSTRHFGPMSLYLAYNKRIEDLLLEMLSKNLMEDAAKLVKIYYTCHNIEFEDSEDAHLAILNHYIENHSIKRPNLELALQKEASNPNPSLIKLTMVANTRTVITNMDITIPTGTSQPKVQFGGW